MQLKKFEAAGIGKLGISFGLVLLLLLITWLGARRLNDDLLFVDEYWSVFKSGGAPYGPVAPGEILHRITEVDPGGMGALYYYALGAWEALLGATPFTARLYSLMIGLLAVAWTYRLGREMFSAQVGLYAALIMGTSAFFVDYLHEVRAYTQFALFTTLVVWAYWKLITARAPVSFWRYAALTAALVGLAYTHYVALSVALVIGVYHLLFVRKNRRWLYIVLAMVASAVLYLPWITVLLEVVRRGVGDTNRQQTSMNAGLALQTLLHAFSNGSMAFFALLALFAAQARGRNVGLAWMWAVGGLIVALAVNAAVPFLVHLRYLMFLWPAFALIAAIGVWVLARRGVNPVLVLAVWVGFALFQSAQPDFIQNLFGQIYRAPKAGVASALTLLRDHATNDDLVLFHISQPGYEPFQLFILDYLMRDQGIPGRYDQIERINNSFAVDDNSYFNDIAATLSAPEYIWTLVVPDIPTTQRTLVVNYILGQTHTACGTLLDRPDLKMTLYQRLPDNLDAYRQNMPLIFGTRETGRVRAALLQDLQAGKMLDVPLAWAAGERLSSQPLSVALHLEDSSGTLVRQLDYGLPTGAFRCQLSLIPLDGLMPGEYTLYAIVYNWQTGERLPIENTLDNRAQVGRFEIKSES